MIRYLGTKYLFVFVYSYNIISMICVPAFVDLITDYTNVGKGHNR